MTICSTKRLKIKHLFILLFLFSLCKSEAQTTPWFGTSVEWTVAGSLAGAYAGLDISDKFGAGSFYETRTKRFDSRFNENLSFLGAFVSYTLIQENKLQAGLMLRGGYENDRFIILVPSLKLDYRLSDRLRLFTLSGFRSEKPSMSLGLSFHFKKPSQ